MAVEDKIKAMLGEQAFHLAVLMHQIDELQKRIAELERQAGTQPTMKLKTVEKPGE